MFNDYYFKQLLYFHCFQILSYLTKHCLDAEGILRVPGSSSRVKVGRWVLQSN